MQFLWKYNRNWLLSTSAVAIGCFSYGVWSSYQQSPQYWKQVAEPQMLAADTPSLKFILDYSHSMTSPIYLEQILSHLPLDTFIIFSSTPLTMQQISYQIGLFKIINLFFDKYPSQIRQYFDSHPNFQQTIFSFCSHIHSLQFEQESTPSPTMTSTEVIKLEQIVEKQQQNKSLYLVELNQLLSNFLHMNPQQHKSLLPSIDWFIKQTQYMKEKEDKNLMYRICVDSLQDMYQTCSNELTYQKLCILLTGCEEESIREKAYIMASSSLQHQNTTKVLPLKEEWKQNKIKSDAMVFPILTVVYHTLRRHSTKQLPLSIAVSSLLGVFYFLQSTTTNTTHNSITTFAIHQLPIFLFPILYSVYQPILIPYLVASQYIPRTELNLINFSSRQYLSTLYESKQYLQNSIQIVSKKQ